MPLGPGDREEMLKCMAGWGFLVSLAWFAYAFYAQDPGEAMAALSSAGWAGYCLKLLVDREGWW